MAEEGLKKTDDKLIHIAEPIAFDTTLFLDELNELMYQAYENDNEKVVSLIKKTVPTYKGNGE